MQGCLRPSETSDAEGSQVPGEGERGSPVRQAGGRRGRGTSGERGRAAGGGLYGSTPAGDWTKLLYYYSLTRTEITSATTATTVNACMYVLHIG